MDLDKIRQMNDEELSKLLKQLSSRDTRDCIKCGKPSLFNIRIENTKTCQTKKLCGLCKNCYDEMLKFIGIYDIRWDS